jgi:preprotein translocase subunit SecE
VNELTKILIWVVIVGVVFAILWWKGYLVQIRDYWSATMEELKKCTWPTWDELKGSTVVVTISILLLGGFTVLADLIFVFIVNTWISTL